ncbi:vesicular transport-associated repeat protein, partial [Trypanosoma conorhini]
MTDAATASAVRDYTAIFSAAMPPVLRSQSGTSSALLQSASAALAATSPSCLEWRPYRSGEMGGRGAAMTRLLLGSSGAAPHTRQLEAGLLRREVLLRGEFDRLRHAEEERVRWDHQREHEARLAEEQLRLLETAKAIELERAKRTEEQQQRVLAQERELEEWKQERAKEMEEQRRRRVEEEDRLRARQHEREMLLMREEAELRLQTQKSLEGHKQSIESTVKGAAESMLGRLREEFKEVERQWSTRFERLQLEHSGETAALRHDIERERQLVARGEAQLSETRAQLDKLHTLVEELRRQKDGDAHSRATETSLKELHQKAVDRLQRAFEEDKQSSKQWFMEEQQRTQKLHESALLEAEEKHRDQVRRLEAALDEARRQLREAEGELQQYKVKLPTAAAEEARLREELRTVRKQLNEAVDAKQHAERQSRELERECEDGRKAQQALQLEMDAEAARHGAELRSAREECEQVAEELARARKTHAEELQEIRRKQRSGGNAVSRDATKEVDVTIRRMNERHEEARRALEAEKAQLTRQVREAEQRHEDARQRLELEFDKLEAARRDGERLKQQLDEKDRAVAELQGVVEELKRKDVSAADAAAENRKLQQELEQLRRSHEAAARAKESELQDLRRDASDARRRSAALQEELTAAQRVRGEVEVRMKRLADEAALTEKQLRREAEEATQAAQSWKDRYTQMQTASASSAPRMQTLLNEKESELSLLRDTIDALKRDRDTLEKRVQEVQTTATTREQEMLDQATTVKALNAEIASLREQLSTAMRSAKAAAPHCPPQTLEHSPLHRATGAEASPDARLAQAKSTVESPASDSLRFAATGAQPLPQTARSASDFVSVFPPPAPFTTPRAPAAGSPPHAPPPDISLTPRSSATVPPARLPEGLSFSAGHQSLSTARASLPVVDSAGAGILNLGAHASVLLSPPASPQPGHSASASRTSSFTVPVPAPSTAPAAAVAPPPQAAVPMPVPASPQPGHSASGSRTSSFTVQVPAPSTAPAAAGAPPPQAAVP